MRYNPATSILAGMTTAQLRLALTSAQQAYLDLSMGVKVVTASYTQGDGAKTVTYTPADLSNLTQLIKQLQAQLGIVPHGRRPMRMAYR